MRAEITVTDRSAQRALGSLARGADNALSRSVQRIAVALGRRISARARSLFGPGEISRSFAETPEQVRPMMATIGTDAPFYAGFQEDGALIRAKREPYLVFQTGAGDWHSVREVTLPAQHYVRDSIEQMESSGAALRILGSELAEEFS